MNWPAALDPKGPEAAAVSSLIWSFSFLGSVIWVLVVTALLIALTWRHGPRPDPAEVSARRERETSWLIGGLAGVTGLIVASLTVISYGAQQRIFGLGDSALEIEVTGHQWWWELRYPADTASQIVVTANELHVPTGRLVRLRLRSADVIHSFWVPSLMGKADLVPGRDNSLAFSVDKPGIYAGSCAEFCGVQHAHMGLRVVAQSPADFAAWRSAQAAPALGPATASQKAGAAAFMANPCMSCHAVRGTDAGGALGPDLTHLASRATLAAGTVPLARGTLAAWITDPQAIKPGTTMPTIKLSPADLNALLDYLMGLT